MRGKNTVVSMKKNFLIYLILGIGQVAVGILGSYYTLIVCGFFLIFKGLSSIIENSKKSIRSMVSAPFALVCAYTVFYSCYMFISELDYAAVRPQAWIVFPIVLTFVVFLLLFLSARDLMLSEENTDEIFAKKTMDSSIENMTIFAILLVGWLGTFVFDFYFDYAAALALISCFVKNIKDYILSTHTTPISE